MGGDDGGRQTAQGDSSAEHEHGGGELHGYFPYDMRGGGQFQRLAFRVRHEKGNGYWQHKKICEAWLAGNLLALRSVRL